jgi:hypothetical protein
MKRTLLIASSALCLVAARPVHAYNGCTPAGIVADKCEGNVAKAFSKMIGAIIKCHIKQADAVFKSKAFDEEACEETDTLKSAKAKFDKTITKLAATCAPALITSANNLRDALLSGPTSLDAQNGGFYCDSASGVQLDPSGNDTGWKPNTADNLKCADGAAKNLAKLVKDLLTCHRKKADGDFKAKFFDVNACEAKGKGKYDGRGGVLTGAGICPGCLDSTAQGVLRDVVALQLNAYDPQVFLCPTTTTSSSVTTTSSTSSTSTSSSSTSSTNTSSTSIPTTSSSSSSSTSSTSTSSSSTSSTSSTSTTVTTTSSTSSSSTSSTSTSVTTSTVTTTTLGFTQYKLTLTTSTAGTTFCGSAGFGIPTLAPFGGQLNDGLSVKIADLGKGCLYFGGGTATAVPGGALPSTSSSILNITGGTPPSLTLGANTGPPTSCTKGVKATNHCAKNPGTVCPTPNVGTGCPGGDTCIADPNCFFAPPLSLPNPVLAGISACVINVVNSDASGTANSATGSASITLPLSSRVYLTGTAYDSPLTPTVVEACPRCISGLCNGGLNVGLGCTPVGPGLTAVECPPTNAQFQAPLAINLALTTGTATVTAASGIFCTGGVTTLQLHAGAFGKPLARTIQEVGTPAGSLTDGLPHATTLASVFCVPKTGNALIDPSADLPGPGAISVVGDTRLQ